MAGQDPPYGAVRMTLLIPHRLNPADPRRAAGGEDGEGRRRPGGAALNRRCIAGRARGDFRAQERAQADRFFPDAFVLARRGAPGAERQRLEANVRQLCNLLLCGHPGGGHCGSGHGGGGHVRLDFRSAAAARLVRAAALGRGRGGAFRLVPEGDASLGQIVAGHFDGHAVAGEGLDAVLAHFPAGVRQNQMVIVQLHAVVSVRQRLGDDAVEFEQFLFRHDLASSRFLDRSAYARAPP